MKSNFIKVASFKRGIDKGKASLVKQVSYISGVNFIFEVCSVHFQFRAPSEKAYLLLIYSLELIRSLWKSRSHNLAPSLHQQFIEEDPFTLSLRREGLEIKFALPSLFRLKFERPLVSKSELSRSSDAKRSQT